MNVYLIDTNLTEDMNRELNSNLSEDMMKNLRDIDLKISIDLLNEEDKISSVLVCDKINLEKMKVFFNSYNITYNVNDITELFDNLEDISEDDILEKIC